ncbi:hypothetical protein [Glycomyces salinus]|uniref:hypothetical protein n=1 Tax=Glycomyces salinus TaxID=980294 RepID=UPI0018EC4F43|nr:hypothetical protein [Glycomyces salinus]
MPQTLGDLFEVKPVHSGDFVLKLNLDDTASELASYVVTEDLAECFDQALSLVRDVLSGKSSKATYLKGSFGAGKSHFLAVLRAVLRHEPTARGLPRLAEVVASHDSWLEGKRFLQVGFHMIDQESLEAAIFKEYVELVRTKHPEAPLPPVYRDARLLEDAAELRKNMGDERFIATLPAEAGQDQVTADVWGEDVVSPDSWTAAELDAAFAAAPGDPLRGRLVSALVKSHFKSYADLAQSGSFIDLDTGLSVISRHAKEVLGYDAVVLLLDELVLWLSRYSGKPEKLHTEQQKIVKLVESAESYRPAPIVSFIPQQRDLRELVGRSLAGEEADALYDGLNHSSGRFDRIELSDMNLPAVVAERLLKPKGGAGSPADQAIKAEFSKVRNHKQSARDVLLDSAGGGSSFEDFEATYPFSPVFMHTIVDVSGALQRNRTALKLLAELLYQQRDMEIGRLMPLGMIFEILVAGSEEPFDNRIKEEYKRTKAFYFDSLRPFLREKYSVTEEEMRDLDPRHPFWAADMVVKTLMLSVLVPRVPALQSLDATRLAVLNQGAINSMIPGREASQVANVLKDLGTKFSQIHVKGVKDPTVMVQLMTVDVSAIIKHADSAATRSELRRAVQRLLWNELGLNDLDSAVCDTNVIWRGTSRRVEVKYTNIREEAIAEMEPAKGAIRLLIDYPFDEDHTLSPSDDRRRMVDAREQVGDRGYLTIGWMPSFFSEERREDLRDYVIIDYLLGREDRLVDASPNLDSGQRAEARNGLRSRHSALEERLLGVVKHAYGLNGGIPGDVEEHPAELVMGLDSAWTPPKPSAAGSLDDAMTRMIRSLLDHTYPDHPNFDVEGKNRAYRRGDIEVMWQKVEEAAGDAHKRAEITKAERETLARIAAPLGEGTVGEASFVLTEHVKRDLDREVEATGHADEVSVAYLRDRLAERTPGLPPELVDLLVVCYAIQDDRTWLHGGVTVEAPKPGQLADEMRLRRQPLPPRDAFETAHDRACGFLEAEARPVYKSNSVASIARQVRDMIHRHRDDVVALADGLAAHADTLGLDETSPRMVTARQMAALFTDLDDQRGDDNELIEHLAAAALDRSESFYKKSIQHAAELNRMLHGEQDRWLSLDGLAARTAPEAAEILRGLREIAVLEEHKKALEPALRNAFTAAARYMVRANTPTTPPAKTDPEPVPTPSDTPAPVPQRHPGSVTRPARAQNLSEVAAQIAADLDPDASYEITVRRVDG